MRPNPAVELAAKERKEHIENAFIHRRAPAQLTRRGWLNTKYQRGFAFNFFSLRSLRSIAAIPTAFFRLSGAGKCPKWGTDIDADSNSSLRPTQSQRDWNQLAQGCEARATLGDPSTMVSTLKELQQMAVNPAHRLSTSISSRGNNWRNRIGFNPFRVDDSFWTLDPG